MSEQKNRTEASELRALSRKAYRVAEKLAAEGRPDAAARARRLGAEAAREARKERSRG